MASPRLEHHNPVGTVLHHGVVELTSAHDLGRQRIKCDAVVIGAVPAYADVHPLEAGQAREGRIPKHASALVHDEDMYQVAARMRCPHEAKQMPLVPIAVYEDSEIAHAPSSHRLFPPEI